MTTPNGPVEPTEPDAGIVPAADDARDTERGESTSEVEDAARTALARRELEALGAADAVVAEVERLVLLTIDHRAEGGDGGHGGDGAGSPPGTLGRSGCACTPCGTSPRSGSLNISRTVSDIALLAWNSMNSLAAFGCGA